MWKEGREEMNDRKLFFRKMAFTVQWEVGLRMSAGPDGRDYGPLGILIQSLAEVEIVRKIPPGAFWPAPKVHSALVTVAPIEERLTKMRDAVSWQQFLAGIFSHRRQTLGNALKHHCGKAWDPAWKREFSDAGFDLMKRPENLSVAELQRLEAKLHRIRASQ
jgi:16S rRNA (adenine1518-N6/adenine1519-N6)-dimethyltransferase